MPGVSRLERRLPRRSRRLAATLTVIASALAGSSLGAAPCTEEEHNRWATACAWAVEAAGLEGVPVRTDPWRDLEPTDVLFETEGDLAREWVAACDQTLAEPERIPQSSQELLSRLGWPSVASICTRESNLSWFEACVADAQRLVGRTRAQLMESFGPEGGLSTWSERTFIHRRCGILKVRVRFTAKDGRDPTSESAEDVVVDSSAYVGSFVAD